MGGPPVTSYDRPATGDSYDHVALHDAQVLEEIELLGELIVMASRTPRVLRQDEIDAALGLAVEISA
jgi:hypothetical protein